MSDFRTSLDAALRNVPRWVEVALDAGQPVNPLYLIKPEDACPVCGTRLRDNRAAELRPCPFGPHSEADYPKDAA